MKQILHTLKLGKTIPLVLILAVVCSLTTLNLASCSRKDAVQTDSGMGAVPSVDTMGEDIAQVPIEQVKP